MNDYCYDDHQIEALAARSDWARRRQAGNASRRQLLARQNSFPTTEAEISVRTGLIFLEMTHEDASGEFGRRRSAVGDNLVSRRQRMTTTTANQQSEQFPPHLPFDTTQDTPTTLQVPRALPLPPPCGAYARRRNHTTGSIGIPTEAASLLEAPGSAAVRPGAYAAYGRPMGYVSPDRSRQQRPGSSCNNQSPTPEQRQEQSPSSTTRTERTGTTRAQQQRRPYQLSQDDRMSSRTFDAWLRNQQEKQQQQKPQDIHSTSGARGSGGIYGQQEEGYCMHLVVDAPVRVASRRSVATCGKFNFHSIPPELRPVVEDHDNEKTVTGADTTLQQHDEFGTPIKRKNVRTPFQISPRSVIGRPNVFFPAGPKILGAVGATTRKLAAAPKRVLNGGARLSASLSSSPKRAAAATAGNNN